MFKPVLFNTEMVRAIQKGTKTMTRRPVKLKGYKVVEIDRCDLSSASVYASVSTDNTLCGMWITKPYLPDDTIYVRETWTHTCIHCEHYMGAPFCARRDCGTCPEFVYKADGVSLEGWPDERWHPSIHMPREAARIFLRVTDVRVERLQEITVEDILREGVDVELPPICKQATGPNFPTDEQRVAWKKMNEAQRDEYAKTRATHTYIGWLDYADRLFLHMKNVWNNCYAKPRPVKGEGGAITHYESYPWEDIHEIRTYRGKPWYVNGNPWIWAIEFRRTNRGER